MTHLFWSQYSLSWRDNIQLQDGNPGLRQKRKLFSSVCTIIHHHHHRADLGVLQKFQVYLLGLALSFFPAWNLEMNQVGKPVDPLI